LFNSDLPFEELVEQILGHERTDSETD